MADAFGRWLERVLGQRGLIVYDSSDPASKPLVEPGLRARAVDAGPDGEARRRRRRRSRSRAATTRRSTRTRTASRCSISTAAGAPSASRTAGSSSARRASRRRRSSSRRRRNPASFSPNVLLRPIVQDTLFPTICYVAGPNELAYLGQLRGVYAHFGVPMPLMYPARDGDAARLGGAPLPEQVQAAARGAAGAGRSGAERPAQDADSAGRRGRVHRRRARRSTRQMTRLVEAMPALDPTLEGAAQVDARPHAARPADAARQDDPGGQAARRDAAPPVRARARPRLSRRPRAGTRRSASCRS